LGCTLNATPIYSVSFSDPGELFSAFYPQISANILGAGAVWNSFLGGQSVSIDLQVKFDPLVPTANGGSATSAFVTNNGIYNVFQQGATAELTSGIDPNGPLPDGII